MIPRAPGALLLAAILVGLVVQPALAESPTPTAPPTATPPGPTPTASPRPSDAPADEQEAAAVEAARAALEATSLLDRLEALRRYTGLQIDALRAREKELSLERDRVAAQIAATEALIASEQRRLDALMRAAYRTSRVSPLEHLLERGSLLEGIARAVELTALGEEHRALAERMRALRAELDQERARLLGDSEELVRVTEAMRVKHETLQSLEARARRLSEAQRTGGDGARVTAELDVLRELAAQQERASAELLDVLRRLVPLSVSGTSTWTWPSNGALSQPFGPTLLELEPPAVFQGLRYPHFHAAIDIAARLYSTVVAAADGRVSFVGHFSDGAMVVLIVHADGYASLYAHLDDGARPPLVRVGDMVYAGQAIGVVGLTGVTTGPHLHFAVVRGLEPVDPLVLLPAR